MKYLNLLFMLIGIFNFCFSQNEFRIENQTCFVDFSTKEILFFENDQFLYSNGSKPFIQLKTIKILPERKNDNQIIEGKHYICSFPNQTVTYDIFIGLSLNMSLLTCIGPDKKEQSFSKVGHIKEHLFPNIVQKYYAGTYKVIQTMKNNQVMENSSEEIKLDIKGFWYKSKSQSVWQQMKIISGNFETRKFKTQIPGDPTIYPLELSFYEAGYPCIVVTNPDGSVQIFGLQYD